MTGEAISPHRPVPIPSEVRSVIDGICDLVRRRDPGGAVSLSLVGSAVISGLRPESDIDLLLVTCESIEESDRIALVQHLLDVSGRAARTVPGRPVELTSLVVDQIIPWRYPATRDLQYGEWLRGELEDGTVPRPTVDANLPVVITSARDHAVPLLGPAPRDLLEAVPTADVRASLRDALPELMDSLLGDERNVLLTLARMVVTAETGRIVPKDAAAHVISESLTACDRDLMELARRGYRGEVADTWQDRQESAGMLAGRLAREILRVLDQGEASGRGGSCGIA